MPQTNITYDTPYNKKLVERLKDLDEKKMFHSYDAYHPSPMGYRMGTFHGQYSEPPVMKGGVAPSKYILNGNSPAYPPMSMNAGIAVHSGGARGYAGMDGAVGGKFSFSDFTKGVADVGKAVAPFAPLLLAAGREEKKGGKFSLKGLNKGLKSAVDIAKTGKDAYDLYSSIAGAGVSSNARKAGVKRVKGGAKGLPQVFQDLAKEVAPVALHMLVGMGRPAKMGDKVKAIADAACEMRGGSFWKDFGRGFKKGFTGAADVAKTIAPIAVPLMMAAGRHKYGKSFNMGKGLAAALKKEAKGGAIVGAYLGKDGQVHHGAAVGGKFSLKGLNKGLKSAVDIAKTGKDAYDLYSSIAGAGTSGGMSLKDVLESTKRIGRDAVGEVKKRGKAAGKDLIKQVGRAAKKSLAESVNKSAKDVVAATGGGRAARAAIVKKVMAEKGLKLIEASKYVKQHGLY
jgi:hypothetical protein